MVSISRRTSGEKPFHISSSVKSGAGAISTSPARVAGPAFRLAISRASNSAIQPPIDEPTTTWGPVQNWLNTATHSSSQRPMVPSMKRTTGLAMAGIVEPNAGAAMLGRPGVKRDGLGALHVGMEAAQPQQAGRATGQAGNPCAHRDPALAAGVADLDESRFLLGDGGMGHDG